MYLTQVKVDKRELLINRIYDNYHWKKVLCRAIPPKKDKGGKTRFYLFRVYDRGAYTEVLIQSEQCPIAQNFGTWHSKEIPGNFYSWSKYQYDIVCYPSIKKNRYSDTGERLKNSRRRSIPLEQCIPWMVGKLKDIGCVGTSINMTPQGISVYPHKGSEVNVTAIQFSGVLEVADRDLFISGVQSGIGPEKAFGYGLLLLKPIK